MKFLLSVYGTLKQGFYNHYLLEGAKFLGTFETAPEFTMYSLGGFPAITKDGNTSIKVEIYEVDRETLNDVYQLEGYSGKRDSERNWYDTLDIDTPWGKAEMFYFKNGVPERSRGIVPDGNWVRK